MTALEKVELAAKHIRRASVLVQEAGQEMPTENLRWNLGGLAVRIDRERRKLEKYASELGARQ